MALLWYFAYGSNINHQKFVHDRGITPLAEAVVRVPGWNLVMNIPGMPYQEPAFASIQLNVPSQSKDKTHDVEGVAYLITHEQYARVVASEGGGTAYRQVELWAEALREEDARVIGGNKVVVQTLSNAIVRTPVGKPSLRYMELIQSASETLPFTLEYAQFLKDIQTYSPRSPRRRLGAALFLAFWLPIMNLIESLTKHSVDYEKGGVVPDSVQFLARFVIASMWLYHDHFHSVLWGRGDGLDDIDEDPELALSEKHGDQ